MYYLCRVPSRPSVGQIAVIAGIHEDKIQLRKAGFVEQLRLVQGRKERQASVSLRQSENSARFGVHADELADAVSRGLGLAGFQRFLESLLQLLLELVVADTRHELLRQVFGLCGDPPGDFCGLGAFMQLLPQKWRELRLDGVHSAGVLLLVLRLSRVTQWTTSLKIVEVVRPTSAERLYVVDLVLAQFAAAARAVMLLPFQ